MNQRNPSISIGALSRQTGCKVETIRYYEKIGLLPAPPRTSGGHRLYANAHMRRLGFIRRGRELGFTLDEIRLLLRLADGDEYNCGMIKEVTLHHLQNVKDKIRDLKKLERTLVTVSNACQGGMAPECPIIDALFNNKWESRKAGA